MRLFSSLKHRPFALLWSGQSISRLGDSLYRIALAWWVLEKTGSATAMGTVLIFSFTPMLLFLLIGGVAVDRFHRLGLMLTSDLLRGGVVAVVALLASSGRMEIWHVYVASILFGFVDAFFQPAYTAAVPQLTPSELLLSANSLTSLSGQLVNVIGPGLGAFIVALGDTPTAFALDALSFFISAGCLVPLLRLPTTPRLETRRANVLRDVREGIGTVLASPWLWISITIAGLANMTQVGPVAVALPFLINDHLQLDVGALGLAQSMHSIGAIAVAVWLGRLTRIRRRGLLAYGTWVAGGLITVGIGLSVSIVEVGLAMLLLGAAYSVCGLIWTNTLQELVPRDMLGRVSSIDYLGSFVLLPVGFGLTGWATDQWGTPLVFIIGGLLTAGLAALGLLHPGVRRLD
ncbi:MAG TPA: MFS transporter [Anaerolineae bacterium]|nr:MFS transporter [Anaerolineae bacterium]